MFLSVLKNTYNICKLKGKPQDLPYSTVILFYIMLLIAVIDVGGLCLFEARLADIDPNSKILNADKAISILPTLIDKIMYAVVGLAAELLGVYSLLYLRDLQDRFLQTSTALFITSVFIRLVTVALMTSIVLITGAAGAVEILIVFSIVWSFIVHMRIFSFAMNIEYWISSIVTLIFYVGTKVVLDVYMAWTVKI